MPFKKLIALFIFISCFTVHSQTSMKDSASHFVEKHLKLKTSRLSIAELNNLITQTDSFIFTNDSIDPKALSEIYLMRGDLQLELLRKKIKKAYTYSATDIKDIEFAYKKGILLDSLDVCSCLDGLKQLYSIEIPETENRQQKLAEIENQISDSKDCGGWDSYVGLGFNYVAPANLVGADVCLWGGDKLKEDGYPMAAGLFSIGYERSLNLPNYYAFKIDPIWTNTILSLHPAQFLYAKNNDQNSIIWRPEAGLSFSSFSINYAYNLPFKKTFDLLPKNMISIKIVFKIIKLW